MTEQPFASKHQADVCCVSGPLSSALPLGQALGVASYCQTACSCCLPSFCPSAHLRGFLGGDKQASKLSSEGRGLGAKEFSVSGKGRQRKGGRDHTVLWSALNTQLAPTKCGSCETLPCFLNLNLWTARRPSSKFLGRVNEAGRAPGRGPVTRLSSPSQARPHVPVASRTPEPEQDAGLWRRVVLIREAVRACEST